MSKAHPKTEQQESTEVVVKENHAVAVVAPLNFEGDAGGGMEAVTQESFAIPFLSILQAMSPQVDEAKGLALPGAKAGMLFNNVTGKLIDGKTGLLFVPCAYRRAFVRWAPKGSEGGEFRGEISPEIVAEMRADGKIKELEQRLYVPLEDGSINEKKCDMISDTRNHYVLIVDEETGNWSQALISLSSTQIKKSKLLMSALASVQGTRVDGSKFNLPTFANFVRFTTVGESNDKGSWFGARFQLLEKRVDRNDLYEAAKAFKDQVMKGIVEVKYESADIASDATGF